MQYRIDDSATLSTRDVVNVDDIEDLPPVNPQPKTMMRNRNLCDSCKTKGCIFQSGIVRSHCDFYKAESEEV